MRVVNCIATQHNLWLLALAAALCIGGAHVAFSLFRRAAARQDFQRTGWILLAATAAGSSIWCTHFISMLAYDVGAPVTYDPALTFLSLLIAIAGSAFAFFLGLHESRPIWLLGGMASGLTISAMHYVGMAAYHVDGVIDWNAGYALASVALAAIFGTLAFASWRAARPGAAQGLFVSAVVSLHFTGMCAITVTPLMTGTPIADSMVTSAMAMAVAGAALIIVGTGVTAAMIDSDASEKTLQSLKRMALNDSLTGLPNRVSFSARLEQEIEYAHREDTQLAVFGIDLDKFKEINDIRGHEAGDNTLKIVGERLAGILIGGEFVARIGGDEFAAIKSFEDRSELLDFIERLERQLFATIHFEDYDIAPGASIGVSIFPDDGDSGGRLVGNADLAMYRAKSGLGRKVCFYEPQMDELSRARRDIGSELRRAVELKQLRLSYQPQVSIATGRTVGHEALLQWIHPAFGPMPPSVFIPIAEDMGTIVEIGEWVLREACCEAASWNGDDRIAVNVSAAQIARSDLPQLVHAVLLETGLPPSRLELEITEAAIIRDKMRSLHILRQIKGLGVTVAIDDFGAGYCSLETLRAFPFDRIKLDRSFVADVERDIQARAVIRAVVALGRSLNISVLAEGVETSEQLALLELEGCNEAQGLHIGHPAPQVVQPFAAAAAESIVA